MGSIKGMKGQIKNLNMNWLGVGEGLRANLYSSELNPSSPILKTANKSLKQVKGSLKGHKRANSKLDFEWVGSG